MNFYFHEKTMRSRNLTQLSYIIDALLTQTDRMNFKLDFRKNLKILENLKLNIWELLVNKKQTLKYNKQKAMEDPIKIDTNVLRIYTHKIHMCEQEISTLEHIYAVLDGVLSLR